MQTLPSNPIIPGYYADPSLLEFQGRFYLYATIDPWGRDTLACWESANFHDWVLRKLNWPTFAACSSPASVKTSKVWAPSVVQGADGRFYMYVSVGSEVWAGVAEHPLGPWQNLLQDRPLIPATWDKRFHMIDAECFIDEDGSAYLYWGSGLNWINGRCFAVRLAPDMTTFAGQVIDVTPTHYFEAPFMHRRGGVYYLTYSDGRCDQDTYQVHCALGHSPLGPFEEQRGGAILQTNHELGIISPGHHAIFCHAGQDFIVYHRRYTGTKDLLREICVDEIHYDSDGSIRPVVCRSGQDS